MELGQVNLIHRLPTIYNSELFLTKPSLSPIVCSRCKTISILVAVDLASGSKSVFGTRLTGFVGFGHTG